MILLPGLRADIFREAEKECGEFGVPFLPVVVAIGDVEGVREIEVDECVDKAAVGGDEMVMPAAGEIDVRRGFRSE